MESRVNACSRRSLNGAALTPAGDDMRDIVAYLAFLSWGSAPSPPQPNTRLQRWAAFTPDTAAGTALYGATCATCHGPEGQAPAVAPALWAAKPYNVVP